MKIKVWVAVISHEHGQNVYTAHSQDSLRDEIYSYVEEYWEGEFLGEDRVPHTINDFPDKQDAIHFYFEHAREFGIPEFLEYQDRIPLSEATVRYIVSEHLTATWISLREDMKRIADDN